MTRLKLGKLRPLPDDVTVGRSAWAEEHKAEIAFYTFVFARIYEIAWKPGFVRFNCDRHSYTHSFESVLPGLQWTDFPPSSSHQQIGQNTAMGMTDHRFC